MSTPITPKATATGHYQGDLRTELTHGPSGQTILTDAPTDNHGRGEAFSPTDLLAASLGACAATVMGIAARAAGHDPIGLTWQVVKKMSTAGPRRVAGVQVHFGWPGASERLDKGLRERLRQIALECPVAQSLHMDLRQEITFDF